MPNALTIAGLGPLREIRCDVEIGVPSISTGVRSLKTTKAVAVFDTGATGTVITQRIIDDLGLQPITMTKVYGVNSEGFSPVYRVDVLLPMNVGMHGVHVTRGNLGGGDVEVLIGMDIITMGDFVITNKGGRTKMTFRVPSSADVDYVQEINRATKFAAAPGRANPKGHRPNPKKQKKHR